MILVLNKIDLAPPALVVAWKHYFQKNYPDIHVICFTSFPKDKKEIEESQNAAKGQKQFGFLVNLNILNILKQSLKLYIHFDDQIIFICS